MLVTVRKRGSSGLSHLFAQGVVAADMLLHDRRFREEFSRKLPTTHQLASVATSPQPGEFEVAYAIVVGPDGELSLPFFSRVNLRNAARQLGQFGLRVALTPIPSFKTS